MRPMSSAIPWTLALLLAETPIAPQPQRRNEMNRLLLPVLIVLFLPACGVRTVKDESPASDLVAMQSGMKRALAPRLLPNGKTYCLELATTQEAQDECAGDLEDGVFLAEQDKRSGLALFDKFVRRLKLQRNPCGFWARTFNNARCKP